MGLFRQRLLRKYIAFLLLIAIVPILFIGLISYQISSQTLEQVEQSFAAELLQHERDVLDMQLSQVENLIGNISGVEVITQALDDRDRKPDTYTNLATQAQIGYILNGYLHLKGLVSIDLFSEGGNHYHVGDTLDVAEIRNDSKERIRQLALQQPNSTYWVGVTPNVNRASKHSLVISAARMLTMIDRKTLKQRPLGLLLVNYSIDHLYEIFAQMEESNSISLTLLDQWNHVIYNQDYGLLGKPPPELIRQLVDTEVLAGQWVWQGEEYIVDQVMLEALGWQLINITPLEPLLSDINKIRNITVALLCLGLFVVGFAGWRFAKQVVQPIGEMISSYKQIEKGSYDLNEHLRFNSQDEIGELVRWFNSFLDSLKAQRASEQALKESEERYELVINATKEVLWDWNIKSDELYLSPKFSNLIGLNPDAMQPINTKQDLFKCIHPEDLERVKREIADYLEGTSQQFQCEYRFLTPKGTERWVLSHGIAVFDESGSAVRMVGSHGDISARKVAENKLRYDAFHDQLTGLNNRAWFIAHLQMLMNVEEGSERGAFAVLFLDLDKFKLVNDTLGHDAGDQLLVEVTERLSQCLREQDSLARLGGDEFVILIEQGAEHQCIGIAERILQQLAEPFWIKNQRVHSGVSIGIAFRELGCRDPDSVLRDADIAMYQAKVSGKNRYVVFDRKMRREIIQRISLENALREAIDKGDIELYFQPIIELTSSRLVGFESLLRWHDKTLGSISPEVFVPIAESSNQIFFLGSWVFHEACRQWRRWEILNEDIASLKLSINISAMQFYDDRFINDIENVLTQHQLLGSQIAFEITETALIRDTELAARNIAKFKQLGISVHLDDFGTGYSSLSHLSDFSIDLIKIDRSFVSSCTFQDKQLHVVKGIMSLAKELGIKSVAEGIESQAQWDLLAACGCEYGQGFHISMPLNVQQTSKYIDQCLVAESSSSS